MTCAPARLLHDRLVAVALDPATAGKAAVIVEGEPYGYARLLDAALRLATTLRRLGVDRGDRVAVYMDNTWPCVVSIYAASIAGAAFVPINPQTKADKLAFMLEDCGAKVLLSDAHLEPQWRPALGSLPSPPPLVCSGDATDLPRGALRFDDALSAEPLDPAAAGTIPLDLAALIYTSGSTGNPKGVMQTHQSMAFACGSLVQYLRLSRDDTLLCVLPLAFDYGLYQLLMALHLGATLVLERSFAFPARIFERMREHGVTVFPGVPTVYAMLLTAHAREPLSFPAVARVTNTAAALPDDVARRLRDVFPNALLYKMYGLTECKRVSYLEPGQVDARPGSVGKAIPGTEAYLLSPDGEPVAHGGTGILHVRGPHVMLGYWNRPEQTEHMLKPGRLPGERVLCTHDWFRTDADGYLYFVGRSDDIIKTRGEKVSPAEVENVLHSLPGVREAAVVGVPDELLGQAVGAFVVADPAAGLDERRIKAHCAARLENFMVPKQVTFCDELPKTATGKVSAKALRERLAS